MGQRTGTGVPPLHRRGLAAASAAAVALWGCTAEHPPVEGCEPGDMLIPDCRFQNPEDLVPSPSGRFILVSQFGDLEGGRPGSIVALHPPEGPIEPLFPMAGEAPPTRAAGWGDAACPPPPLEAFAPHGIDIETLSDGRQALYAVNHGGRESVEMFEVDEDGGVRLTWRGCVLAPEDGYFNDLVVLQDGGFWVSHMYPREANTLWAALRMELTGYAPGFVYQWRPGAGFTSLAGTTTKFANGVEKSQDERFVFVNGYFGDRVLKVDAASGEVVGAAEVSAPDNLAWTPDGRLLAASHHASIPDTLSCFEIEDGSCGFRFQVVAVDPESMTTEVLLDHAGPPMGAATVALPLGEWVYLGTFAGDRVTRAPAGILAAGS